jgi:membrane protease YdiL (CAAX protease family)
LGVAEDIRGFKAKYGPLTSKKWFIAGELVLVLLVNIFRWVEPFGTLFIGWTSLWLRGMTWRDVGLTNPKSWKRTLLFSAVFTVVVIAFSMTVSQLVYNVIGEAPDTSMLDIIKGNYYILAFMLLSAVSMAGFPEELAYRAYLFNRLTDLFSDSKVGYLLAAVASSLLFGYVHYYEGLNAVISISLLALLFVSIYLLSRKNIWALIIIHSAYDVFAFIVIFYS